MVEIFDNIRKIYRFKAPRVELAGYIEFFSESSADATRAQFENSFNVKMFPSFTPTFWINLGPQYKLAVGNKCHLIHPGQDILIVRNSIVERRNLPQDYIFTVKFFPGALESILNVDQSKMINNVVDLRQILPGALLMKVRELELFEDRVRLLEEFFLVRLKKAKQCHYVQIVNDTISCYEAGDRKYNVTEIAERLFTTSKSINRYFTRVIGTTPKNFFLLTRARTALTAYVANSKTFNPSDFGYYDMSHFHKSVVQFTGHKLANHTS